MQHHGEANYYAGPAGTQHFSFQEETKLNFKLQLSLGNAVEESLASEVGLKRLQQTFSIF